MTTSLTHPAARPLAFAAFIAAGVAGALFAPNTIDAAAATVSLVGRGLDSGLALIGLAVEAVFSDLRNLVLYPLALAMAGWATHTLVGALDWLRGTTARTTGPMATTYCGLTLAVSGALVLLMNS